MLYCFQMTHMRRLGAGNHFANQKTHFTIPATLTSVCPHFPDETKGREKNLLIAHVFLWHQATSLAFHDPAEAVLV